MNFTIRKAEWADVDDIAEAHLDSIRSIGPHYYPAEVVGDWGAAVRPEMYVAAMSRGVTFYIAIGQLGNRPAVLGFSSHYVDGGTHGTGVYVRGQAARSGIGTALLQAAEAVATGAGAATIELDASLAAVEFYKANGFEELGRGEHRLTSGRTMACVFMRKNFARPRAS